jgi:hypothetical protein
MNLFLRIGLCTSLFSLGMLSSQKAEAYPLPVYRCTSAIAGTLGYAYDGQYRYVYQCTTLAPGSTKGIWELWDIQICNSRGGCVSI